MLSDDVKRELNRKNMHYIGLIVPILYYYAFAKEDMLAFIGVAIAVFAIIDYCRLHTNIRFINYFFEERAHPKIINIKTLNGKNIGNGILIPSFNNIMRSSEKRSIGAHTFFALGTFVCILLYPKNIAIAAIAALVIGDSAAAIVGKAVGKHALYKKKTVEGFLSCLVVSFFICYSILLLYIALVGAIATAITELVSSRLNDNLTIPIVAGGSMTLANIIIG
ncbi:MAG: diacylglycerol/polyprenol kinase family protein [Candidatus Methanofastidiosia archaeon]